MKKHQRRLLADILVVATSIAVAVAIAKSSYIGLLVSLTDGYYLVAAFVAGLFFTSAFTTAPAIAVLAKLSLAHNPALVALVGGVGALLGDLVIFSFVKSHVREDVMFFLGRAKKKRIRHLLEHRFARWSLAFLGAIIIASPLPDELGLAMMGLSNVRMSRFVPISLTFNIIGILMIAFIARSI